MTILFKDELPLDHEECLEEIVKQWSKDDAEEDGFHWETHYERNWNCLENWLKEFEGLDII